VTETPKQSDQLPEEAPDEQVHDDTGGEGDTGTTKPGGTSGDDEGTATGSRDAAGSDE
jgi:hypothetical protein